VAINNTMSISKIKKLINILLEAEMQSNNEPFGKILFSPQRKDNVDKSEPNTVPEDNLKNALKNHYDQTTSKDLEVDVPVILDLINQGKYNDILKPSPGYAYRILSNVFVADAINLLDVNEKDIIKNASDKPWIIEKPIILSPKNSKSNLQSWTYNLLKLDFGEFRNGRLEIILEAPVENNVFFMNPRAAEKLSFISNFSDEYETISVGSVTCSRVLVYYTVNQKLKIDLELVKKYVDFINKKGHQIEEKINNEILDFYHKNGLFLDVHDIGDLSFFLNYNNFNKLDEKTKDILHKLSYDDILLQETIKKQQEFIKFFRDLAKKISPSLLKDFRENNNIIAYFGILQPLDNLVDKTKSFYTDGVKFKEIELNKLKEKLEIMMGSNVKDDISKTLFRTFQRKQKY